jgi:2'-5' RNA ligase
MSKPIRAFIAVRIPPSPQLRQVIAQLERFGRPVKACDSRALHVTLKFLGDTRAETVPAVAQLVADAVQSTAAFTVRLTGLGAFPNAERPTVVWAGIEQAQTLIQLAGDLEDRLKPLGFAPENRRFRPHLTLARIKSRPPADLLELLNEHAATNFGTAELNALEILQSELRPQGPHYTTLARCEFM